MKRSVLAALSCALLSAAIASGAEEKKPAGPPKPGAEVKKLAYFVGTWNTEGEVKQNPMMPAGKVTSTDVCTWYPGKFFVVCNSKGHGPMGAVNSMGLLGYSTEEKAYTYSGIDSTGYAGHGSGSTDGKSWTYTSDDKMGGKVYHGRYTISDVAPESYSFKYEMSEDNKTWNTIMEGKSTKAAAAPKK